MNNIDELLGKYTKGEQEFMKRIKVSNTSSSNSKMIEKSNILPSEEETDAYIKNSLKSLRKNDVEEER